MFESLITISAVGFFVGFFFSIPVAGPVSIIITSHSLRGERHFALATASGAAIVDFIYCFVAVYGFTNLYYLYDPFIPYTLLAGSIFLIIIGYKIRHTHLDLKQINEKDATVEKLPRLRKRGRFFNGFIINLLNPSLFIGWLTSSFVVLSFVASLGFNVGGLERMLENNVESFNGENHLEQVAPIDTNTFNPLREPIKKVQKPSTSFQLLNSFSYAIFVAFGSVLWFFYFSRFLVKRREKIKTGIIDKIIHLLGFALWGFAIYLVYKAIDILFA